MRKIFSFLTVILFAGSMMAAEVTVTKTVSELVTENGWEVSYNSTVGTLATEFDLDDYVSVSTNGDPNCGSIWGTAPANDWRLYHSANGDLEISANGTIKSVSLQFTTNQQGCLRDENGKTVASEEVVEVNASSVSFTVGNTNSKTNGQVRITSFTVVYEEGEGGGGGETPKVVDIIFPAKSNVCYTDMVDEPGEGWWQFQAEDSEYYITLSNSNTITKAAGTYTVAQLDAEYSYIYHDDKVIAFKSGSLTLKEENGQVSIAGTLQAKDGKTYNISLVYVEPVAEKTVNIVIHGAELDPDDPEAMEAFILTGTAANNDYVQIVLASEQIAGKYDESHIVEDEYYPETMVMIDEEPYWIYTASIKVYKLAAEGEYKVLADLLCYNSVLYKVDMTVGDEQTGLDALGTAVKALKRIVNGNLVIERAGRTFNVQGAVIR